MKNHGEEHLEKAIKNVERFLCEDASWPGDVQTIVRARDALEKLREALVLWIGNDPSDLENNGR